MAVTSTSGDGVVNINVGSDTATVSATALAVTTGFKPRYVKCVNHEASGGSITIEFFEGMGDSVSVKQINDSDAIMAEIANGGIVVSDSGFTCADSDLVTTDETVSWIAMG